MANKKLHIVIISTWMPVPGDTSGIYTRDQAEAIARNDNKVSIFMFRYYTLFAWIKKLWQGEPLSNYLSGKLLTPIAYNFVNPFPSRFSADPMQTQKKAFLNFIDKKFSQYIKRNGKPDVIHHHEIADFCYISLYLSKKFSIPYILTEHSPYNPDKEHFNTYETKEERLKMIRQASERIAVSTFFQKQYERQFGAPFITIPNIVTQDFTEKQLPAFPKQTNPFHFINIGSSVKARRQNILFRAFAGAFKDNPLVQLTIVSKGPLEEELKALITSLDIQNQIHMVGQKTKDQVLQLLDESNVLVVCSEYETFSVVAAEALTRGNPVLSTRCGGPEDFVNEHNGLLCNVNDVADMQEKLLTMHNKYTSFNYIQIAQKAVELFSEQTVVKRLEDLYRKVISK